MKASQVFSVIIVTLTVFGPVKSQLLRIAKGGRCEMKDGRKGVCTLGSECEYAKKMNREGKIREVPMCSFIRTDVVYCCPTDIVSNFAEITESTKSKSEQYCDLIKQQPTAPPVPEIKHHIYKGVQVNKREFPHMVAIGFEDFDGLVNYRCGGVLLSRSWVLTASHCLKRGMKKVRVGSVSVSLNQDSELPQEILIKNYTKHENYRSIAKYDDIALLELERPVLTNEGMVKPICLPTIGAHAPNNKYIIAGWGYVNKTDHSDFMLKANVVEHPHSYCVSKFQHFAVFNSELGRGLIDTQICAQDMINKSDTCQGDSGGPMFYAKDGVYYMRGITSFGLSRACSTEGGAPGVYTKVESYLKWIEKRVWPDNVVF